MKKQLFFAVLATAMTLVGCSKDEVTTSAEFSDSNAIGFKTYVPKAAISRGSAIGSTTDLQTTNFDVFAFTGSDQFMGTSASDGVKIAYSTGWDYATESEKAYWPSDASTKIDFYAVSPEIATGLTKNFLSTKQELTYAVSSTAAEQCDLMYAEVKQASKGDRVGDGSNVSTGGVKLNFNHALSQIVFKAKAAVADYQVDVESVTIHNLTNSGTFAYSSKAWTTINTIANYAADIQAPVTEIVNTAVDLTTSANALLLIPQVSTAWDVNGATKKITDADVAKQTYIEISCKIANTKNGVSYIWGDAANYATIYVPFKADWTQANKYTYTIVFCDPNGNNGYNPNGEPTNDDLLISFDPIVAPWVDQSNSDITL